MAEAPFFLDTMGLDCYTCPEAPGFQGIIKRHSEDFVVTEVDCKGECVALTSRDIPPLPEMDDEVMGGATPPAELRPSMATLPPLKDLVTTEQYTLLKDLASSYAQSLSPDVNEDIHLGCYGDKMARGTVHLAVRSEYPMLMTRTVKDKQDAAHIYALPDPKYMKLRQVLNKEDSERLLKFLNIDDRTEGHAFLLSPDPSKENRTKVHLLLHELYGSLLSTRSHTSQHGSRRRKRIKLDTPISTDSTTPTDAPQIAVSFRGKRKRESNCEKKLFTKFVIKKKNIETLAAIDLLSDALECQPSQFSFAGVKDKKAVTTQTMTVRDVTADRLDSVLDSPLLTQIELGNYEYTSQHIRTGEHSGNHFRIALRNVRSVQGNSKNVRNVVPLAMEGVKKAGFVNYFGPQRFGGELSAARIGLAMVQGKHQAAVDLILSAGLLGTGPSLEAKEYYASTRDVSGTLKKMPTHNTRQRYVLKALHRHGTSEFGCTCALMSIPYAWRRLYFQSFTSLLWNHLTSYRVKEYGLEPVEGDLVLSEGGAALIQRESVHVLTSRDIQSGRYSMEDVVLPIVGISTICPENKVASHLKELLAVAGVTLASFRMSRLGIHHAGTYRKLISYPKQLSWKWLERDFNPSKTVKCATNSGLNPGSDLLAPKELKQEANQSGEEELQASKDVSVASCKDTGGDVGSQVDESSVEMCFSLDTSCYATVMLRELMKVEP